uniref:Uncharacterized protein n=1 Tax=Rhizophora mucronata TaxID=61149 RepID=A0A2P2PLG3_RHIMU
MVMSIYAARYMRLNAYVHYSLLFKSTHNGNSANASRLAYLFIHEPEPHGGGFFGSLLKII